MTKFILIMALALIGTNACYPSDYSCVDNVQVSSNVIKIMSDLHQVSPVEKKTQSNSSDNEVHYCFCSLSCHAMFLSNTKFESFDYLDLHYSKTFLYTAHFYPQVIYSLEKPPTV